jgi:TraM recognition site of TraD and TraG
LHGFPEMFGFALLQVSKAVQVGAIMAIFLAHRFTHDVADLPGQRRALGAVFSGQCAVGIVAAEHRGEGALYCIADSPVATVIFQMIDQAVIDSFLEQVQLGLFGVLPPEQLRPLWLVRGADLLADGGDAGFFFFVKGLALGQVGEGDIGWSPVLFVLDEFATLGHMRQIEDAAGQIAGYGVKLWPILQDLGQLKALYRERWETFMGNAGILQFFGNNDLTTLEWISKRIGTTTIQQLSSSAVTPGAAEAGATGRSYAPHTAAVLEPHEAALVFGRPDALLRQLVIRAGFAPMILQRAYYDKHRAFAGLRK